MGEIDNFQALTTGFDASQRGLAGSGATGHIEDAQFALLASNSNQTAIFAETGAKNSLFESENCDFSEMSRRGSPAEHVDRLTDDCIVERQTNRACRCNCVGFFRAEGN